VKGMMAIHNQQFWANHPTFSLSFQIVEIIIRSLPNMIFTNSKLQYQINQLMNNNFSHKQMFSALPIMLG
jgi:hypothetical protein